MLFTILAIAGFQGYWLKENYKKAKQNLDLNTGIIFRETVRRLQARKLKLDSLFNDTTGHIRIDVTETRPFPVFSSPKAEEMTGFLNDITIRVNDSLIAQPGKAEKEDRRQIIHIDTSSGQAGKKKNRVISLKNTGFFFGNDSANEFAFNKRPGHPEGIVRFLYGIDSLQDSLRIHEIDSAFRAALIKEGIQVTYTLRRFDSLPFSGNRLIREKEEANTITLGFAHPVTYEMILGNNSSYLIQKLLSPILFSLFLVGVTVFSFVILYRNLQRQKKLTDIKNEFISNITHELKTPIATMGVAIEALRNFNAIHNAQRTQEYLDISQNELHRLSLLVDKVLNLSIFEKKEIELKYEPLNLQEVVKEVISSMRLQIEKKQATVTVQAEGDTTLLGDRLHLLSVIFNLLDNALKYGKEDLSVRFDLKDKKTEVKVIVADNGIGILPEYKEKVFEKFFRVPAGNTHNTKGYGLGLSYVAYVIQQHRGTIEVESQPGQGTRFIIGLPKKI